MATSRAGELAASLESHREVSERRRIDPQKRTLLWLNALGGSAVLASYAWSISAHAGVGDDFWGGVPAAIRPLYTVTMLLAATGYFAFSHFVFRLRPDRVKVSGRFGYGIFKWIYALILVPSALWMPLTLAMIENPGPGLWLAIRLTLAAVGLGSLMLLAALIRLQPATPRGRHRLAVAGSIAFCVQTALLDALVWPAFFLV